MVADPFYIMTLIREFDWGLGSPPNWEVEVLKIFVACYLHGSLIISLQLLNVKKLTDLVRVSLL